MNATLATAVYVAGILGLFYLNRDSSARTSKALWIPVVWFWIIGSRAVSVWLGMGSGDYTNPDQLLEGSPTDALIFGLLLAAGLMVLARRASRVNWLLKHNWIVVAYFLFGLMSITWSDFPAIALKRWIKALGDIVMAFIVFTDPKPFMALQRLLSRLGFVLFPMSLLLIKYYPHLGRYHEQWTGAMFNGGVTTNKNSLGVVTYLLSLGALWQVLRLRRELNRPYRWRQYVAQCTLLGFGIWLLSLANSATSTACFTVGCISLLVTTLPRFKGRPRAVQTFVVSFILFGGLLKLTGADKVVVHALGRKPDLTGRANEIWPLLISMAPNPLLGAGFESFWLGPRLLHIWNAFPNLYVNEAHNGYIEIYLNFGLVGLILILSIIFQANRTSIAGFRRNPHVASLMLSYVLTTAIYSYTEAGFRTLSFPWGFLLLGIVGASTLTRSASQESTTSRISMNLQPKPASYVSQST